MCAWAVGVVGWGKLVVVLSVVCGYRGDEVGLALEVSLVHMSLCNALQSCSERA
jgi:hypothetical protein